MTAPADKTRRPADRISVLCARRPPHLPRSQMREDGIAVLLVEQNARMSLAIADHAYVLDNGAIVYAGRAKELAADDRRVQALAGASVGVWQAETIRR